MTVYTINPYRKGGTDPAIDLPTLYQLVNSDLRPENVNWESFMIQQLPPVVKLSNSHVHTMHITRMTEQDFNDLSEALKFVLTQICTETEKPFKDSVPPQFTRTYSHAAVFIVRLDLRVDWNLASLMGKMNKLANLAAYNGILIQALVHNLNPLIESMSRAISLTGQRRPQVYGFRLGERMELTIEQLHSNFQVLASK